MESDRRLSLSVGVFVIVCLAGAAYAILTLTSQSGVFTSQYTVVARFENVQGLLPGAPIWLAGKQVGSVVSVELMEDGGPHPVRVELRIDGTVQRYVRMDSIAKIGTIGVLGDSYVDISVGSEEFSTIVDGNEIQTETPANLAVLLAKGTRALDNMATLAGNLNGVVTAFADEEGSAKLADAVNAVSDIVVAVEQGNGLLHSLIYDEYRGGGVDSIQRSLSSLESIMDEIKNGDGIFHSLIYDSPADQDVVMQALEAGAKMNSIMGKVDRGEGSLGMLVNDPSLYEDLKVLLGGAHRSAVLRTLIRLAVEQDE
jgi:phospholipid/cholesterol/gamma-HCH transport system substrate-binding protein